MILEITLISFGLAMDCFAVSIGVGACRRLTWKDILTMAFMFGLFQGLMPLAGWFVGSTIQSLIDEFDHWIAFAILAMIGLKMIWQSWHETDKHSTLDIRNTKVLFGLALATSIDAMITGVSLGLISVNLLLTLSMIGFVTFMVTITGAVLGSATTFLPERWVEFAGGVVLIGIGAKILFSHLLG